MKNAKFDLDYIEGFFLNFLQFYAERKAAFYGEHVNRTVETIIKENKQRVTDSIVTLKEFHEQTKIMHPVTAKSYFLNHPDFLEQCGEHFGDSFLIKKNAAIRYLASSTSDKIRFRARRYLREHNQLKIA
jgi:hypothetical protein